MALNFAAAAAASTSLPTPSPTAHHFRILKRKALPNRPINCNSIVEKQLSICRAAPSEGVTEESGLTGSSTRAQLDLLEQLTSTSSVEGYESDGSSSRPTIRDQLSQLVEDRDGEFSLPLGKRLKASMNSLTISQKRNIRRQAYMDTVSQRNDSVFFAIIGAFIILPPLLILVVAILTGYVDLRSSL